MPWMPHTPVALKKGEKHCLECYGTGMVRVRFGGSISDDDFQQCSKCEGTGKASKRHTEETTKKPGRHGEETGEEKPMATVKLVIRKTAVSSKVICVDNGNEIQNVVAVALCLGKNGVDWNANVERVILPLQAENDKVKTEMSHYDRVEFEIKE